MTDIPDSSPDQSAYEGYVMDAENAAEMARLMLQDHILTQAMGGPLPEQNDASQIHDVLDIACGPGGWLLDLVTNYPHIQGIGFDISNLMIEYANGLATAQDLSNLQFHVMDGTKPLQFPDNTFDMVNGRLLIGVLTKYQWTTLLSECYRILRPGGILRLTEGEWGITNSVAYDSLTALNALSAYRGGRSFSPHGRTFAMTPMLRFLLKQAGYQDTEQRPYVIDYSAGAELHENYVQNLLVVYKQLQPFFMYMQVASQEEIQGLYEQMEKEFQAEDFCAIDYYLTAWGRKGKS